MLSAYINLLRALVVSSPSKAEVGRTADCHPNTLIMVDVEDWNPTPGTMLKLERALLAKEDRAALCAELDAVAARARAAAAERSAA